MIIDFTVENYRSIKDTATLSAIAATTKTTNGKSRLGIIPDEEIARSLYAETKDFSLLPVVAIYGGNASGKTNLVRSLDELLLVMAQVSQATSDRVVFDPFFLNIIPSKFQLRVILNGTIYTYELHIKYNKIEHESLTYISPGHKREKRLYQRNWDTTAQKYLWKNGEDFSGSHIQLQQSLEDDLTYMSILCRLKVNVLDQFTHWLLQRWQGIHIANFPENRLAVKYLSILKPEWKIIISEVVKLFDTGIENLEIVNSPDGSYRVSSRHELPNGGISWDFTEESAGTQRLVSMLTMMMHAFEHGTPMIVDELDSNIHPVILETVIMLFQSIISNPKRAQLIFSTHDNVLQRRNLLRRDQIWFTQKRRDGSTELYPLSDYRVRNDLVIDKAYLSGRFGAIPTHDDDEIISLVGAAVNG